METKIAEILENLDNFNAISIQDQKKILSQSLQYLHCSQFVDKIIYYNSFFHAVISLDKNQQELMEFLQALEGIQVQTDKGIFPEIIGNLFKIFKNQKINLLYSSRIDYALYIIKIFKNIGIDIKSYQGKDEELNLYKHMLIIYGLENAIDLKKELIALGVKEEACEKIGVFNIFDFFKNGYGIEKANPVFFTTHFNQFVHINEFLIWTNHYFDSGKKTHMEWLNHAIENSIKNSILIDFTVLTSFYSKRFSIPELDEYFQKYYPNNFIKELYNSKVKIMNLKLNSKELLKINDFKKLIEIYYLKSNKKLVSQLSNLCLKNNGCFDFSPIYLGQIVNHLDINHIHRLLEYIYKNDFPINLTRPFVEIEQNLLNYIKSFINGRNVIEFLCSNPKFDYVEVNYFLIRSFKYIQNKVFVLPKNPKNVEAMIKSIDFEVYKLKNEGYELPVNTVLDGFSFDDYTIKFPRTNIDLTWWGRDLNNCLTGENWSISVFSKKSLIFGLFKNQELTYCVEIENELIKQFEGRKRSKPSEDLKLKLTEILENKSIIKRS